MGGRNSGGHNRERITAESCAQIDAAVLRRMGLINPGTLRHYQMNYSRGDHFVATLNVTARPEAPTVLRFTLIVAKQGLFSQIVPVSFTSCNYGKERGWLHCPKCGRRVFRLFYYPNTVNHVDQLVHYFACRQCYNLTYDLRRQRGFDHAQTRTIKAGEKLRHFAATHGDWKYLNPTRRQRWDTLPRKPKWMRRETYSRLADAFTDAKADSDAALFSTLTQLLGW